MTSTPAPARLEAARFLPDDGLAGTLVGRVWRPAGAGRPAGPTVVALLPDGVRDIGDAFPTMSTLLDHDRPAEGVRAATGGAATQDRICSLDELLDNDVPGRRDVARPFLLAPCDLQVIKACGVTFASSLLERVIEEQARGDAAQARALRGQVLGLIGDDLADIEPGSPKAAQLKALLKEKGLWSQYLEVGIGPDAEVFTKAPVLSAVGSGEDIGIRADSSWNNPEPEVVLAVNSRGEVAGATLGNDVNLRDIEGRSALLLGKAKDNNASCAIGPLIRLFDETFDIDAIRTETVDLHVVGEDGFELHGVNRMSHISRDPLELVRQTLAAHQYPDGFMLFLGTLFAPIEDRDEPGGGFTHKLGDLVSIRSARLGCLRNRVTHSETAPPWRFGLRALYDHLAARGVARTLG